MSQTELLIVEYKNDKCLIHFKQMVTVISERLTMSKYNMIEHLICYFSGTDERLENKLLTGCIIAMSMAPCLVQGVR